MNLQPNANHLAKSPYTLSIIKRETKMIADVFIIENCKEKGIIKLAL